MKNDTTPEAVTESLSDLIYPVPVDGSVHEQSLPWRDLARILCRHLTPMRCHRSEAQREGEVMADIYVTIPQSGTTSTAFTLPLAHRPLAVSVPSLNPPADVHVQFAASSGATFAALQRGDGSGAPLSCHSGAGPAWAIVAGLTAWARFTVSQPQLDVRTLQAVLVNR
jgi:hypothetical protein